MISIIWARRVIDIQLGFGFNYNIYFNIYVHTIFSHDCMSILKFNTKNGNTMNQDHIIYSFRREGINFK